MAFSAPTILKKNWPLLVKFGATKTCTYKKMASAAYAGGNVTKPTVSSHPGLEIVFDVVGQGADKKYQFKLEDGSAVRTIDKVAIFPALDLPVVPVINDLIVDPSSVEWIVKAVSEDPVNAHYELLVRPI
jgi:hypothetical protein